LIEAKGMKPKDLVLAAVIQERKDEIIKKVARGTWQKVIFQHKS